MTAAHRQRRSKDAKRAFCKITSQHSMPVPQEWAINRRGHVLRIGDKSQRIIGCRSVQAIAAGGCRTARTKKDFSSQTLSMTPELQNDALDLVERDLIVAAIVELGRARALMRRHLLGVLEETAVEQIDGDAGRPKAVAAEPSEEAGRAGAADDHAPGVLAGHPIAGELLAAAAAEGAEQR